MAAPAEANTMIIVRMTITYSLKRRFDPEALLFVFRCILIIRFLRIDLVLNRHGYIVFVQGFLKYNEEVLYILFIYGAQ